MVAIFPTRSSSAMSKIRGRSGGCLQVPSWRAPIAFAELTRVADIKLNARVSLRLRQNDGVVVGIGHCRRPDTAGEVVRRSYSAWRFRFTKLHMITDSHDIDDLIPRRSMPAWAEVWHLWTIVVPRRSITGRLLYGKVWRRHDGRRWIYKKFVEYRYEHPK